MTLAPVKQCPACLGICHRVTRVCPGCNLAFYASKAVPKPRKLVLVEEHADRSENVADMLAERLRDLGVYARVRVNWNRTEKRYFVRAYNRP